MRNTPREKVLLTAIWLAFVARGAFYCVEQPLWEGFDEWAHFAVIQEIAEHGKLPARSDGVSTLVEQSLQLVPLSESASHVAPGTITHDLFWRLPPVERRKRQELLRRLSAVSAPVVAQVGAKEYEAQQPPLYYILLVPVYLVMKSRSLPAQVLILRLLSMIIASTVVILGYRVAALALNRRSLAMLAAVLLACLPGYFIDICRIGNDALAIALTSALILVFIQACYRPLGTLGWLFLGVLMAMASLTKAYTLALLPLLPILAALQIANNPERWQRTLSRFGLAFFAVVVLAGWWYWRCWMNTGTLSGEQLDVAAAAQFSAMQKLSALAEVNWRRVADSAAFSHLWVGGWSFLLVRSWMYRVFELIGAVAAIGVGVQITRTVRQSSWHFARALTMLLLAFAMMCAALGYHALVVFMVKKISTALGWYLYPVIVPEVVLLLVGIYALLGPNLCGWGVALVCLLAAGLDVYTVHFLLMPYYSGLISHNVTGSLASFHISKIASLNDLADLFHRLSINKPARIGAPVIAGLWAAYLFATAGLVATAITIACGIRRTPREVQETYDVRTVLGA